MRQFWSEFQAIVRTPSFLRAWAVLILLALALHGYAERRLTQQHFAQQREMITDRLSIIRYQLEAALANNLSLINGAAAFIATNPDFTPAQFERYARAIIAREAGLVNLAAAPGLVVRHIYPIAGNERAMGLDYMQTPIQREQVLRAIETGGLVIAGPIELVQGGQAFVGRAPVFVQGADGQDVVWGVVSAPVRADAIYASAGLTDPDLDFNVAIRQAVELNVAGEAVVAPAFLGEDNLFSDASAVIMPVVAGDSVWELAAVDRLGQTVIPGLVLLRLLSVAAFVLLSYLLLLRYRQLAQNQTLQEVIFQSERFLRAVESVSQVGGWRWSDNQFTELSDQTRLIMQIPQESGVIDLNVFCHSLDQSSRELIEQWIVGAQRSRTRSNQELELRRRDGDLLWLNLQAEVFAKANRKTELIGALSDITQQKKIDQLVEYQANYDLLTGLPNRALFIDRVESALLMARRNSTRLAVLFVDLDNFKSVNDNLGHDAGDDLLIESAARIKSCVRSTDTVARYSGDEFVALLVDVFSASIVSRVADQIVMQMRKPFVIDGHQVYCGCSVGVAFFPDDGDDADTLVIKADQAMYEVKKSGRNAWQFYTAAMQLESETRHHLYNELVAALDQDKLTVFYQPVVEAVSGQVVACEALVRWQLADGQYIAPDIFIPIAEERGLISRIDVFVLRSALDFLRTINQQTDAIALSVNVSPKLLYMRDGDAHDWLRELQSNHGVPVTIEITERVLLDGSTNVKELLVKLDKAGIKIAIDDFGTGYSGLSYFSRFPVSSVKIDRSFVRDLGHKETETTLVETILLLAQKLGVLVVAEGVETQGQADFLRDNQCHLLQGYYIAPPLSGDAFAEFVRQNRISVAESH